MRSDNLQRAYVQHPNSFQIQPLRRFKQVMWGDIWQLPQLSRSNGNGCRRGTDRHTHRQTDTHTHTDIPRTDQRLKTYEIFFSSIFISYCSSAV